MKSEFDFFFGWICGGLVVYSTESTWYIFVIGALSAFFIVVAGKKIWSHK